MDADVLAKLDLLIGMVREVQAEQRQIRDAIAAQGERIARIEGRLDEQSRILAAMIPTGPGRLPPAGFTPHSSISTEQPPAGPSRAGRARASSWGPVFGPLARPAGVPSGGAGSDPQAAPARSMRLR